MIFKEKTYSVLVVSSNDKFSESTTSLLPSADYYPVRIVKSCGEARRILSDKSYDLILINTPLTDEFGTGFAMDLCQNGGANALLFVKADLYDEVFNKVTDAGVMVISKPTSSQMVSQTLRIMCAARERMRNMETRQASVEDKIKEIRLINKAKWCLIEHLSMTEEESHRYIEKQAMDMRLSKKEVAENIIKTYSSNRGKL